MEALAAVSLAGNILQFVDATKKLVSAAGQFSRLGAKEEHIELSSLAHELRGWVSRIMPPDPPQGVKLSQEEESIRALATQCNQVSSQLLEALKALKTQSDHGTLGRVTSFYTALLAVWKNEEVEALQARLDRIGDNIQRLLASYDSRRILRQLDGLDRENRRLEIHRSREIQSLREQFETLFTSIKDELREEASKDHIMKALLKAAAEGSRYSAEQMILEHLHFAAINDRQHAIRKGHKQTLSWLFGTHEQCSPATFDDWLVSGDDTYWISGKPGSGKSTLMKFLVCHEQTKEKLNIWAARKRLICAEYFFWGVGRQTLQKSQEGLLRSLIYQILCQCPDMIPQTYPSAWRLYFPEDTRAAHWVSNPTSSRATIMLSVQGLLEALRAISAAAAESETKFCFFIDGLDEYEGDPTHMIDLIRVLRTLPNAKLCLSSRAWNQFEQEFGKDQTRKLYMQDFNRNDINAYVYDSFANDKDYQELDDKDTSGKALIEEIVKAANGVFLWVFLVVRSLQEGFTNGDCFLDLRRRLNTLPTDLNEYFERILLFDVDKFYHGRSAETFFVALEAAENLALIAYWFMDQHPSYALELEPGPLAPQQLNRRFKAMKKQLNARCKGLLEVQDLPPRGQEASTPSSVLFNWKVDFLHRTVRDFLMLDDTKDILQRWCPPGFDPHLSICRALLAQIKTAPKAREYWGDGQPALQLCHLFDHHARELASRNHELATVVELSKNLDALLDLRGVSYLRYNEATPSEEISVVDQGSGSSEQNPVSPRDGSHEAWKARILGRRDRFIGNSFKRVWEDFGPISIKRRRP